MGDLLSDDLHAGAVGSFRSGGSGADRLFSSAADDQMDGGRDEFTFELDGARDLFVYTGTGRWSSENTFGDEISGFQDGSDLFDMRGSGLEFNDLTIVNGDFPRTAGRARSSRVSDRRSLSIRTIFSSARRRHRRRPTSLSSRAVALGSTGTPKGSALFRMPLEEGNCHCRDPAPHNCPDSKRAASAGTPESVHRPLLAARWRAERAIIVPAFRVA
jgi:hypothetical protein